MIISFENKKMNAVKTAKNGVVNQETIFRFFQHDQHVSASYSGGKVVEGYLIGKVKGHFLEFTYTQIHTDGKLDGGHSECEIKTLDDGRLQLIEHFEWSEGRGTNIIEELK